MQNIIAFIWLYKLYKLYRLCRLYELFKLWRLGIDCGLWIMVWWWPRRPRSQLLNTVIVFVFIFQGSLIYVKSSQHPHIAYSLPHALYAFLLYLYYIINFFRCQLLYALGFSHCSCSKPKIILTSVWSLLVVLKCKLDKFKKLWYNKRGSLSLRTSASNIGFRSLRKPFFIL